MSQPIQPVQMAQPIQSTLPVQMAQSTQPVQSTETVHVAQPNQVTEGSGQILTQMQNPYATYTDYTTVRLTCTPSEQKQIPNTGPDAKGPDGKPQPSPAQFYHLIPLMYNTGTEQQRALNDFLLEGCEMDTSVGIQSKSGQNNKVDHSIMCNFDITNPEHDRFIRTMNQIHSGCAYILQAMKGAVKLYNFNAQMAEATGLKHPVYRPRDEVTGDPIQGRKPSMFLKLFSRGKPPMVEQTLFTGLDGKPIPWTLLRGVEMKFIPLIHVKRIYVGGGKASIQMEVVSAIVTSIRARNTSTKQIGTIDRLKQARPELVDLVAGQVAKLTIDRQDQLLGSSPETNTNNNTNSQDNSNPTFSGVTPTGSRQTTANPTQMQDFTANAPVRSPQVGVVPAMPQATLQFN